MTDPTYAGNIDIEFLQRLFEPVGDALTPEAARTILDLRTPPDIEAKVQEYAARNAVEGAVSPEELDHYRTLVSAISLIGIVQGRAQAALDRQQAS